MTRKQAIRASKHDWFISMDRYFEGKECCVVVRDDMKPNARLTFTDFDKLKEWAGY